MSSPYRPPFPRWQRWVAGAVLAALLGGIGYAHFDRLIARRVADGAPIDARVTAVWAIPRRYDPAVDHRRLVVWQRTGPALPHLARLSRAGWKRLTEATAAVRRTR